MTDTTNKSFILHKDSLLVLDQLSMEQAGALFKAIYSYQKTGEIGEVDQLIRIAINPFINQFKRDSEKWKNECEEKSKRGKIGNLKRWHKDIYKKLMAAELTLDEALSIAQRYSAIVDDPVATPTILKSLKSDSKNDSDSKNKNDNILEEKNIKKEKFKKPTIEEIKNYVLEISAKISPESFFDYYESKGWKVGNTPMKDWKATVRNWSRKEQAPKQTYIRESESDQRKRFFQEYANKLGDE